MTAVYPEHESIEATSVSGLTVAGIRAAVRPVLRRLGDTAGAREKARDYAFGEVRALADAGIVLVGVAREDGGAGGSLRDVADVVIEVARATPVWRRHCAAVSSSPSRYRVGPICRTAT